MVVPAAGEQLAADDGAPAFDVFHLLLRDRGKWGTFATGAHVSVANNPLYSLLTFISSPITPHASPTPLQ